MRIAIVNTSVPFVYGGAEVLADNLKMKFDEYGFASAVVKIPFQWTPPQSIVEHMLACRFLNLDMFDRVIVLKFPVYYIPHTHKVLWLLHQFRQAYDFWDTPYNCIPKNNDGLQIRKSIMQADKKYLEGISSRYTISKVITERLMKFNQMSSTVLYPPLLNPENFYCAAPEDYIYFPSRLSKSKRQKLAIESMRFSRTNVKLILSGSPDSEADYIELKKCIEENGLEERVKLITGWLTHEEKVALFSKAIGVMFIPYDEDYGYITLEAFASHKPVITCLDSGGPLEFVEDGVNGYSVPPNAHGLADAIDRLVLDKNKAARMGENGFETLKSKNVMWDHVIRSLTA